MQSGRIVCVGLGMMLGAHLSPRARNDIEQADMVFAAVSDPLVELWLQEMHRDVRSLQHFYGSAKSRVDTYREMVEAMLAEVRRGANVCGVFYGHPGVFAQAPHRVIAQARAEGFAAHMEPGISAEDCLYADLGIDPGTFGCQHYEATQLMVNHRRLDPSAYLVVWQVGIAGDLSFSQVRSSSAHQQLLVELLLEDYPAEHDVVIYEAATLAIAAPRIERAPLSRIVDAQLHPQTTLVVPPARAMQKNHAMIERLARLDAAASPGAASRLPTHAKVTS